MFIIIQRYCETLSVIADVKRLITASHLYECMLFNVVNELYLLRSLIINCMLRSDAVCQWKYDVLDRRVTFFYVTVVLSERCKCLFTFVNNEI